MGTNTTNSWSVFIPTGGVRSYRRAQETAGEALVVRWLGASVSRLYLGQGESCSVREII